MHDELVAVTDRIRGITTNAADFGTPKRRHDDNGLL
jgi:hypothetical protein